MLTPYMAAEFRDLRETGVEDALVVATLEEAMRHQAKHPWCYAKRLLDQAAAQHVTTFAEWEKTHIKNKGNRVDRETPSGNNILGLTDSLGRIKRRPFKKQDPAEKFEDCFKRPFHIAYGQGKELAGARGEWLCFIVRGENEFACIAQQVDGVKVLPGKNYTSESLEAAHDEKG